MIGAGVIEKESEGSVPNILIVDDNPLILNVLKGLFSSEGFCVLASQNGSKAREILESEPVDVIVCDVMMPEMDGHELHHYVREHAEYSHISFVFLTALGSNEDVLKGKASGADDYMVKPFDPEELLAVVRGKIKRSRTMAESRRNNFNSYRRKMVQTLSHEFRTPLVAINTGTELLLAQEQDGEASNRQVKLLEAIHRGGQRLERLVNDFVLYQQIESGIAERLYHSHATPKDARILLNRCVEECKAFLGEFEIDYLEPGNSIPIRMYEPQLKDALDRILSNVKKFSKDRKKVSIRCSKKSDCVYIGIRDYGVGMTEAQMKSALEPFTQIDRDRMEQQGSGLGLAIVRYYVELNGGSIDLVKPEGDGLLVELRFPVCSTE